MTCVIVSLERHLMITTRQQIEEVIAAKYPEQADYWLGNDYYGRHTPTRCT